MSETVGRRERKRRQTADHLAETAWSLFESRGFEQVTMEAIAEAADVAKGTLYKHFLVKEALLVHTFHAQLKSTLPALLERLEGIAGVRERLRTFFMLSADWSESRRAYLPHYLRFRMQPNGDAAVGRSGTDLIFAHILETGIGSGELRDDLPLQACVHYLSFLYLATLLRWLDSPNLSLTREFEAMLSLFIDGLAHSP